MLYAFLITLFVLVTLLSKHLVNTPAVTRLNFRSLWA